MSPTSLCLKKKCKTIVFLRRELEDIFSKISFFAKNSVFFSSLPRGGVSPQLSQPPPPLHGFGSFLVSEKLTNPSSLVGRRVLCPMWLINRSYEFNFPPYWTRLLAFPPFLSGGFGRGLKIFFKRGLTKSASGRSHTVLNRSFRFLTVWFFFLSSPKSVLFKVPRWPFCRTDWPPWKLWKK